jgi:hypothetical protein
MQEMKIRMKY